MKITKEDIKEIVTEAITELGMMDASDAYGPQDEMENVLDLLYSLEHKYADMGKLKHAVAVEKAQKAIRRGDLEVADQILVFMFKTGGRNRAVYHAIAYVRELLGK